MSKLFDILDTALTPQPTAAQLAADRAVRAAIEIRRVIREQMTAIATDAQALGMAAILAEMDAEVAGEFQACLPLVKALWEAAASLPFPELPLTVEN